MTKLLLPPYTHTPSLNYKYSDLFLLRLLRPPCLSYYKQGVSSRSIVPQISAFWTKYCLTCCFDSAPNPPKPRHGRNILLADLILRKLHSDI